MVILNIRQASKHTHESTNLNIGILINSNAIDSVVCQWPPLLTDVVLVGPVSSIPCITFGN